MDRPFPVEGACARAIYRPVIAVKDLVRRFGATTALGGISWSARPGEVLGLLGENGAGKTTALRVITGFLAATSGSVSVDGHDVAREPARARAAIGYLPEHVPLYPEMRVGEYLGYRAALKGVPWRQRRGAVRRAAAEVGIEGELDRVIGRLSHGFRQRVGLADALSHQPRVLLLDEPTDGLDPNQRSALLEVVRDLGRERTVVLSTHVLSEAEAVCGRVVILAAGKVAADGTIGELAGGARVRVTALGPPNAIGAALRALAGVRSVDVEAFEAGTETFRYAIDAEVDVRDATARAVLAAGGALHELGREGGGLAARFAELTRAGAR